MNQKTIKSDTERIQETRLVLVEGIDDVGFFEALLAHLNITGVQVMKCGGKEEMIKMINRLSVKIKSDGFSIVEKLVIIQDANSNPKSTFQSITTCLRKNNLAVPNSTCVFTTSKPAIGVFIMPSISEKGALETLCLKSVADEPVMNCVSAYFDCIYNSNGLKTPDDKHLVQVYLASKEKAFLHTGLAAKKNYWSFDHPAFQSIRAFLTELAAN